MVKPVAWCNEHGTFVIGKDCPTDFMNSWKPLYTAPQIKQLSADEMHEVAKQFLQSYDLEVDQGLYGDTSTVLIAIEDWYGFARAILKKASEK